MRLALAQTVLLLSAALGFAQTSADGQLLPTGWRIDPAGTQIQVGSLPTTSLVSPDNRFLLTLNSGAPASISVIRLADLTEASRVTLPAAWKGLVFSADGRRVYASGGNRYSIYELTFSAEGALALSKEMPASNAPTRNANDFLGDLAIPPGGRLVYAADLLHDRILVFNPQSGKVINAFKSGRRPYQILFHPDGKSYWVSSWADGSVYQYETDTGYDMSRIRLGPHPTAMVLSDRRLEGDTSNTRYRLFVAAANTNNLFVVGVDGSKLMDTLDVLNLGFSAGQPAGMTPLGVALSPDQTQLYVVCADVNAVAVADISEDRSRLSGFIPVGAYPTSARALSDGRLAVLNSESNTVSVIPKPDEESLPKLTDAALALVHVAPETEPTLPAPIEDVVYISPDQDTGPNHDKLAQAFAALPHYFPDSDGPTESLYWSLAGIAPPFTRLLSHALPAARFLGSDPANVPPAGYLFTNARSARMDVRNYGVLAAAPKTTFLDDLAQFEQTGMFPRLTLLRATSDAELGQIVQRISRAPFWRKTAIFIGGAHPLIVSPYSRGAKLPDTGFFNDTSLARTMEMILKLRPMTLFDAAARPLPEAFASPLDPAPYEALP